MSMPCTQPVWSSDDEADAQAAVPVAEPRGVAPTQAARACNEDEAASGKRRRMETVVVSDSESGEQPVASRLKPGAKQQQRHNPYSSKQGRGAAVYVQRPVYANKRGAVKGDTHQEPSSGSTSQLESDIAMARRLQAEEFGQNHGSCREGGGGSHTSSHSSTHMTYV